jgi:hypothetical protein
VRQGWEIDVDGVLMHVFCEVMCCLLLFTFYKPVKKKKKNIISNIGPWKQKDYDAMSPYLRNIDILCVRFVVDWRRKCWRFTRSGVDPIEEPSTPSSYT